MLATTLNRSEIFSYGYFSASCLTISTLDCPAKFSLSLSILSVNKQERASRLYPTRFLTPLNHTVNAELNEFGNKIPRSNIDNGRDVAIAVDMALKAMRNGTIEHWKTEYNG